MAMRMRKMQIQADDAHIYKANKHINADADAMRMMRIAKNCRMAIPNTDALVRTQLAMRRVTLSIFKFTVSWCIIDDEILQIHQMTQKDDEWWSKLSNTLNLHIYCELMMNDDQI